MVGKRSNEVQRNRLVDLMEENFFFLTGRHALVRSLSSKDEIYVRMAEVLNGLGPAKSPIEWKRCFQDMKSKLKEKVKKQRRYVNLTGGCPSKIVFTGLEKRILALCSVDTVEGNQHLKIQSSQPTQSILPSTVTRSVHALRQEGSLMNQRPARAHKLTASPPGSPRSPATRPPHIVCESTIGSSIDRMKCGEIYIDNGHNCLFLCILCDAEFSKLKEFVSHAHQHVPKPSIATTIKQEDTTFQEFIDPSYEHCLSSSLVTTIKHEDPICFGDTEEDNVTHQRLTLVDESSVQLRLFDSDQEIKNETPDICAIDPCAAKLDDLPLLATIKYEYPSRADDPLFLAVDDGNVVEENVTTIPVQIDSVDEDEEKSNVKYITYDAFAMKPSRIYEPFWNINTNGNQPQSAAATSHEVTVSFVVEPPCYECTFCNKTFVSRQRLKSHQIVHDGRRPHQCQFCPRAFARESNLRVHVIRIHIKELRHKCAVCGKAFYNETYLIRHLRETHLPDSDIRRHFTCTKCDEKFKTYHQMRYHQNMHTFNSPSECDICHKTFSNHQLIYNHMRRMHILKLKRAAHEN